MRKVTVGIADYKVANDGTVLESMSLGSCVGVAIYDPKAKVGGLAHIMLPDSKASKHNVSPRKYADTAIRLVIEKLLEMGANKKNLKSKIAGGSCMFESMAFDPALNIGERNVEAVKKVLAEEHIPIVAKDVGKNYGRTLEFIISSGKLAIKSVNSGVKYI